MYGILSIHFQKEEAAIRERELQLRDETEKVINREHDLNQKLAKSKSEREGELFLRDPGFNSSSLAFFYNLNRAIA